MIRCYHSLHLNSSLLSTIIKSTVSNKSSFSHCTSVHQFRPSGQDRNVQYLGVFQHSKFAPAIFVSQKRPLSRDSLLEFQTSIFNSISFSTPVHYAQEVLVAVHNLTGLEWGPTIVLSAFLLRLFLTLPVTVYQHYILAKFENVVTKKFPEILEELKRETATATRMFKWDNDRANYNYAKSARTQYKKIIQEENCHPLKASLLVWIQMPLWICSSFAVRNLLLMRPEKTLETMQIYADISTEKFLWLDDLLACDHSFVLPATLGIFNLAIIEMQILYRDEKLTGAKRYTTNVFRAIALLLVPIAANVPSILSLYWASSAFYGFTQNLILWSPNFRKFCGIPFTKKTKLLPYRHMVDTLIKRYYKLEGGK
uniref:Mitochondrial inner membrane protein COX18 n=1 Tax=Cacopsylla melanoneura TaxID=428564 RepID=A0A8D8V4Z8_9HEMI